MILRRRVDHTTPTRNRIALADPIGGRSKQHQQARERHEDHDRVGPGHGPHPTPDNDRPSHGCRKQYRHPQREPQGGLHKLTHGQKLRPDPKKKRWDLDRTTQPLRRWTKLLLKQIRYRRCLCLPKPLCEKASREYQRRSAGDRIEQHFTDSPTVHLRGRLDDRRRSKPRRKQGQDR